MPVILQFYTVFITICFRYVILKVRAEMFDKIKALLPTEIEVAVGDKMCCKIMFFTRHRKPNSLSVMLECANIQNFDDAIVHRRKLGYELVQQCPSPDFFFPVNQRIRVSVGGRFPLNKHIGKPYYFLTFFPLAADNFIIFPVERYTGIENPAYGIISFAEDNGVKKKEFHVVHYDPWSSKGKTTSKSAPVGRKEKILTEEKKEVSAQPTFDESKNFDLIILAIKQNRLRSLNAVSYYLL